MMTILALLLFHLGSASAFTATQAAARKSPRLPSTSLSSSYLESLQGDFSPQEGTSPSYLESLGGSLTTTSNAATAVNGEAAAVTTSSTPQGKFDFCHAPLQYFAFDNLVSKGPRATFDWGTPQDWSRKLADDGVFRAGSWYCSEGGWPSPNGKAVTEVFYMLEGHGALGDADGVMHYFGPGDMVIIPKGHTGRWDVNVPIHKVWAVNAHASIEETSRPIRVQVDHYNRFAAPSSLTDTSSNDPLYGNTGSVQSASNTFYDVGPTKVGVWTCEPGSFAVSHGARQWFHMLEGVLFITDSSDGTSKRCVAGDTVLLPEGWYGYVDVIEPAKKVFTVAL